MLDAERQNFWTAIFSDIFRRGSRNASHGHSRHIICPPDEESILRVPCNLVVVCLPRSTQLSFPAVCLKGIQHSPLQVAL